MRNTIKGLVMLLVLSGMMTFQSCFRKMTSAEQWREIVQTGFTVDSLDNYHMWDLLQDRALSISVKLNDSILDDISLVQVLNGNPYEIDGVEILAERPYNKGVAVNPSFKVPTVAPTLYVAAVSSQGKYYVMPVESKTKVVIGGGKVISDGLLHRPIYQTFTYLFEENYPLPGDFDFNDVVLRISQHAVDAQTLKVQVTLAAVGASTQVGAAIHMPSLNYSAVEKVTIDEGSRFDEGYSIDRYFISNNEVVSEGLDGTVVINLFDDAHWCMNSKESMGQVVRMFYNTQKYEVANESAIVPTVTRTYTLYLNEGQNAYYLPLSDIDPFIMVNSNGRLNVEIHTYRYKYQEAIWEYTTGPGDQDDRVPWALLIPDATFHYPIEGVTLGQYRKGEISGAYCRYNHSFGQWARNRNGSTDWWLYDNATKAQVY